METECSPRDKQQLCAEARRTLHSRTIPPIPMPSCHSEKARIKLKRIIHGAIRYFLLAKKLQKEALRSLVCVVKVGFTVQKNQHNFCVVFASSPNQRSIAILYKMIQNVF